MNHHPPPRGKRVSAPDQPEQAATPSDSAASRQMQIEFSRLGPAYRRLALHLVGALLKVQRRKR